MADDKNKTKQDRLRIAANQPYEVGYFRKKHGLSQDAARKIIQETRGDREKANEMARNLRK
ncbi:DUF3606 domain-containing protein [Phyllobacterium salinisoli]|uniref:DUF3606 domain-containing protein n=1 Tax=Phyllobacterium salinisoli TaxID=1899321 RepID=A0A368KAH8_9HYPH|nr:DUF3606 domain-containing protein [Phyllobacterium salinisoli]RCS25605.1 DUF3606 domain-containing protein [Phyllobacterium salinisoli]